MRPTGDQDHSWPAVSAPAHVRQASSAAHYIGNRQRASLKFAPLVKIISRYFDIPMVQINLLDAVHQYTVAAVGTALDVIPRSESFCDNVVRTGLVTTLDDLASIPAGNESIRTYVGLPILGRERSPIGTLCLMDHTDRQFDAGQIDELRLFGQVVADEFELLRRLGPRDVDEVDPDELAAAIFHGDIAPRYQPIVDLHSGRVVGAEALARWTHPARGAIPPFAFVPRAEDSDLIIDLDLSILQAAALDAMAWQRPGRPIQLNVNVSANHFASPNGAERLIAVVRDVGADPSMITFEVTETRLIHDGGAENEFLAALHGAGHRVVLDDFGVGYSSVNRLLRLPVDGLKLDSTVTAGLAKPTGIALMRNILHLADDLKLDTVVEGIETPWQAGRIGRLGGRLGQGRLWSDAVEQEEFLHLVRGPLSFATGRRPLRARTHAMQRAVRKPWAARSDSASGPN